MSTNEYDKPCVRNQDLIMRNEALTEDVRVSLNTIVKLKSTIEKLEQDIRQFESDPIVESLRFKIVRLEVELATAKSKKQTYGETINQRWEDDIRNEMGNLNDEILSLRNQVRNIQKDKKLEDEKNLKNVGFLQEEIYRLREKLNSANENISKAQLYLRKGRGQC